LEASESQGQQVNPGELELQGQLGELLFDQAVGLFNLTQGLGVVWDVEPPSDGQVLTNQLSDLRDEGGAIVLLETLWKAKTENDVMDESVGHDCSHSMVVGMASIHPVKVSTEVRRYQNFLCLGI
jgi:hypothetical protein